MCLACFNEFSCVGSIFSRQKALVTFSCLLYNSTAVLHVKCSNQEWTDHLA